LTGLVLKYIEVILKPQYTVLIHSILRRCDP
jgi:hypothetical protein